MKYFVRFNGVNIKLWKGKADSALNGFLVTSQGSLASLGPVYPHILVCHKDPLKAGNLHANNSR